MRDRLAVGAAIIALTILSYFQFPGHTYLGSDTQIYVPMLEHIWDSSALTHDLVATKPHLAYTLYDEIAIALRWITHSSFRAVLIGQQFIFRALEILGVYLLTASFPLARRMAMLVAAFFTLGATIVGPAVLIFEYEPVPRAFAVGLIFLAIGLAAQEHLMLADLAAALAFLYHPPTVWVFWLLYLWYVLRHRDYRDLWPLAIGIAVLFVSSRLQPGGAQHQDFFTRVSPESEEMQRMRTSYNWISTWSAQLIWQYILLWIVSLLAFWRIRPKTVRLFLLGMPAIGLLSIPLSYVLLEQLKWGLIPQFQPARATLFITAFAVILAAAAGIRAAEAKRWIESAAWFVIVFAVPLSARVFNISQRQFLVAAALATAAVVCVMLLPSYRDSRAKNGDSLPVSHDLNWPAVNASPAWKQAGRPRFLRASFSNLAVIAIALAPFFVIPIIGRVRNYREPDLAAIDDLARFARSQTPKDAVFLFADAGTSGDPSVFRAESLRALYVDWKSGGQINYHEVSAQEWWQRWQAANQLRYQPSALDGIEKLPIDFLVLQPKNRVPDRQPVYQSPQFVVYKLAHQGAGS
ncbi:MAG TPA: DUF6798 domain-containing protein [Bryobacteraceae bacterium]|nr:DUF6798 domain-containing protein [Bryobacteraceae bacterium]